MNPLEIRVLMERNFGGEALDSQEIFCAEGNVKQRQRTFERVRGWGVFENKAT